MSISVNDGGVLRKLDTISDNVGGTLKSLDVIHSNDGGVLRKIFEKIKFKWYNGTESVYGTQLIPVISGNIMTLNNISTSANGVLRSDLFTLSQNTTLQISDNVTFVTYSTLDISVWENVSGVEKAAWRRAFKLRGSHGGTYQTGDLSIDLKAGTYRFKITSESGAMTHVIEVTGLKL